MPEAVEATNAGTPSEPSSLGGVEGGLQLSDEDILGIEPDGAPSSPATEPAAETPAAPEKAAPTEPVEAQKTETPAPTPEPVDDLKWMRPLLNDKVFGPKLQSMHDRLLAFQELYPTVADARAMKELGSAQELKEHITKSQQYDGERLQLASGDPEQQQELAQVLHKEN